MRHWYVGYPTDADGNHERTYLRDAPGGDIVKEVFWGDTLAVSEVRDDGWLRLTWGPLSAEAREVFFPVAHAANLRPLEIVFLDVGQGDGAVLISPEHDAGEAVIVIDAGEGDHMHRFLRGRFGKYASTRNLNAAVITHPDLDHYGGFRDIFEDHEIGFDVIYQGGLLEGPVGRRYERLGRVEDGYITDLALTTADVRARFSDADLNGRKTFARTMKAALDNPRIGTFATLSRAHGTAEAGRRWMPGFAPGDGRPYTIEVVGPAMEHDAAGTPRLPKISGGYGKTKNGHSVLLRLHFGRFRVFFGGDLNRAAEENLLCHAAGISELPPPDGPEHDAMVAAARDWFAADVMKVCHHGSADVTDAFIRAVGPVAFVISSGDAEGHVHPRPDLLGRLGKLGASAAPVILSTELQRSTREREDARLVARLARAIESLDAAPDDATRAEMLAMVRELGRDNVQVSGAIYLKTDGQRLVTAFRKETDSETDRWFHFLYRMTEDGLVAVS